MAINSGLGRAHRLIQFTAAGDTRIQTWANGRQPGWEAKGWKSWDFQPSSTGTVTTTGLQLVCYGTLDPATAYSVNSLFPALTNARWLILPAPTTDTGTGIVVNPITAFDGSQSMQFGQSLEAFGLALIGTWTGGGTINVDIFMAG